MAEFLEPTQEPRAKLAKLGEFTTSPVDPSVIEFAHLLSERLDNGVDQIAPIEVIVAGTLLIYDLNAGVNGYTGEPINTGLIGQTPETYDHLRGSIPMLAEIAFPPQFATEVKRHFEEIQRQAERTGEDVSMLTIGYAINFIGDLLPSAMPEEEPSVEEEIPEDHINLKGLDKAIVLAALFNGAQPQGMGFMRYDPTPMTIEEARELLKQTQRFDYLKGRAMKVNLLGDKLDPWLYDQHNGPNAARMFIDTLRESENPDPDNIVIHEQHLTGAEKSAQRIRELLDEDPSEVKDVGEIRIIRLGLDDVADKLGPKIKEAQEKIRRAKETPTTDS